MAPAWLSRARGSVRLRVTLLAAGLFAVTLFAASALLLSALERSLIDDVQAGARDTLVTQAEHVSTSGFPAGSTMVSADGPTRVVRMMTPDGMPAVAVFSTDKLDPEEVRRYTEKLEQQPTVDVTTGTADSRPSYTTAGGNIVSMVDENPELLGMSGESDDFVVSELASEGMVFATASPLDQVRDTIASTRGLLWVIGPALVTLVVGLSWVLVGRALRPVHAVTSRVAAIGSHSLHERVPVPRSNDEIAELARTMNSMLGRLEVSTSASRRLVSDASHELRTPVTVMRTELEVARHTDAADWTASSDVLLGELDRLQELIDDLLLLARGDEQALSTEDVSIDDLARDVAARRRQVPVEVTLNGGPHVVTGDEAAVKRALDHVVANAARHADTEVAITVTTNGDGAVVIHVDDDGAGIPESERAEVVRRFVRLDEARDRDSGGAGLGLAVTSDVLAAHGGSVTIGDAPLGGARLTLTFPGR